MKNLPANVYLAHSLVLTAIKWFGDGRALGRNCLVVIKACNAIPVRACNDIPLRRG